MVSDPHFRKYTPFRGSEFMLSYDDDCVFIDLCKDEQGHICIQAISFDGHGYDRLQRNGFKSMNDNDSVMFEDEYCRISNYEKSEKIDQLVFNLLKINISEFQKSWIADALREYRMI